MEYCVWDIAAWLATFFLFREVNDKLEAAKCLTQEVIHIFQDKILTNDEDAKPNLWLESVSTHYHIISMIFWTSKPMNLIF